MPPTQNNRDRSQKWKISFQYINSRNRMKNLSSVDLRGNVAEIIWEKFVDIDIFLFVIIEHFFFSSTITSTHQHFSFTHLPIHTSKQSLLQIFGHHHHLILRNLTGFGFNQHSSSLYHWSAVIPTIIHLACLFTGFYLIGCCPIVASPTCCGHPWIFRHQLEPTTLQDLGLSILPDTNT